jgi:hypothetical protein
MKNAFKLVFPIIIVLILSLLACSAPLFAPPGETPTASLTLTNVPTSTHTLTATPTKALSATPSPIVELGEKHVVAEGGFSFRVPFGYMAQIEERQAFISDIEQRLVISFASVEDSSSAAEEIIDEYLNALATRSDGEFEKTPADPVAIGGLEGTAFDLNGSLAGFPVRGKTFLIPISPGRFLFALAISNLLADEQGWEKEGAKVFEAVLESMEWVEPQSANTCPLATDDTYGYTQENAIRVGEGSELFGGPARERAYLDNLRGPNGEPITYERTGSINFEETILDAYEIHGLATPVTLYIDIYKFEELKAPVGFTCAGPFNVEP